MEASITAMNDSLKIVIRILKHDLSYDLNAIKGYISLIKKKKNFTYLKKVTTIVDRS
ncbi:MAG: hypothetical protein ACFFD4_15325 [Candidatus Odinarchaeota archaeon]